MAAADFFRLTITGKGGHAGLPHTATDTIAAAAELVGSLQHIVSRRIDPLQPAVVTIGSFHAGDAPNVIPGHAELTGTTRSFDPDVRERLPKLIDEIARGVCAAHGADYELDFQFGYRPVSTRSARRSWCARRSATRNWSRSTRSWAATTSRPIWPRLPGATPSSAPAASTPTIIRASGSTSGRSRPARGSTSRSRSEPSR